MWGGGGRACDVGYAGALRLKFSSETSGGSVLPCSGTSVFGDDFDASASGLGPRFALSQGVGVGFLVVGRSPSPAIGGRRTSYPMSLSVQNFDRNDRREVRNIHARAGDVLRQDGAILARFRPRRIREKNLPGIAEQ